MPLHTLTEPELRNYCKEYIESLELWLRRIINEILIKSYGQDYYNYSEDGVNLINKKIKDEIQFRIKDEPERYARPIDACLPESEIKIITNPNLYAKHFREIFKYNSPEGRDELLTFISRLIQPRNKLYHANPISIRESERVICYTNDIIDCIKIYYQENNMNNEFNVPLILKYSDSLGNVLYRNQFTEKTIVGYEGISFAENKSYYLRPGDRISIEVEVDPTFSKDEYTIRWTPMAEGNEHNTRFIYEITMKDVGQSFTIACHIKSNKEWHRLFEDDDVLVVRFKVLPPPSYP